MTIFLDLRTHVCIGAGVHARNIKQNASLLSTALRCTPPIPSTSRADGTCSRVTPALAAADVTCSSSEHPPSPAPALVLPQTTAIAPVCRPLSALQTSAIGLLGRPSCARTSVVAVDVTRTAARTGAIASRRYANRCPNRCHRQPTSPDRAPWTRLPTMTGRILSIASRGNARQAQRRDVIRLCARSGFRAKGATRPPEPTPGRGSRT